MIYLLLVFFVALLYFTYLKFDKDVVAPPVVLVAGYMFSIICASVNVERWSIDLHFNTFGVLVYGTMLFVVVGYIVKKYVQRKYTNNVSSVEKLDPINVNGKYLYLFIVFQVLVMSVWVWNIYSITDTLGTFNSFSERMVAFRRWSSYDTGWMSSYTYGFINQFNQIVVISPYLFLYIIIKNYFAQTQKYNITLSISILLSVIQILLNGGRFGLIILFLNSLLYYFVFYQKVHGHKYEVNRKMLCIGFILLLLGLMLFFYLKSIVGRGNDNMEIGDIIPYITMYVGGPIQLLDIFLQNPLESSEILGKETFYTLNIQLQRLGVIDIEPYIKHLEFRTASTGVFLGNIYTAYRSYLYDFGIAGLTILPVIFSAIANFLYYKIIYSYKKYDINYWLLLYSLFFYTIFCDFVRCSFFATFCSFSSIKQMLFIVLLSEILVKGSSIWNLVKSMVINYKNVE